MASGHLRQSSPLGQSNGLLCAEPPAHQHLRAHADSALCGKYRLGRAAGAHHRAHRSVDGIQLDYGTNVDDVRPLARPAGHHCRPAAAPDGQRLHSPEVQTRRPQGETELGTEDNCHHWQNQAGDFRDDDGGAGPLLCLSHENFQPAVGKHKLDRSTSCNKAR